VWVQMSPPSIDPINIPQFFAKLFWQMFLVFRSHKEKAASNISRKPQKNDSIC
jgi:hypothetical protein